MKPVSRDTALLKKESCLELNLISKHKRILTLNRTAREVDFVHRTEDILELIRINPAHTHNPNDQAVRCVGNKSLYFRVSI